MTLRSSRLTTDDKKRVSAETGGQLEMKKVTAAIRMLGSNFFQDMTGVRRDKGQKVYESMII